jgi:hypothetical protein
MSFSWHVEQRQWFWCSDYSNFFSAMFYPTATTAPQAVTDALLRTCTLGSERVALGIGRPGDEQRAA